MATATLASGEGGAEAGRIASQIDNMDAKLKAKEGFSEDAVLESDLFKISTSTLKDERMGDNVFYTKLVGRLNTFYVQAEKYRLLGPNQKQADLMKASGFPFHYRLELHKCLKKLLLEVVSQRDERIANQYLKEVYAWFFKRLTAMGALSKQEYEAEFKLLNPMTNRMADAMKGIVTQKMQSVLVNEEEQRAAYKAMF